MSAGAGASLEAGLGPKQMLRMAQWGLGVPIAYSFFIVMLGVDLPDPMLTIASLVTPTEWTARVVLFLIAAGLEFTDMVMVKGEEEYESKVHEILKGIGDRLRAGAAVESAVAEAVATNQGPSQVFSRAIELSDTMPFEASLRQAADECGSTYLREVCYLVAEAVQTEGDSGSAVRRLGMELERNHQYTTAIMSKISNPVMVMRAVGLFAVPPLYASLRYSFNRFQGGGIPLEAGARWFFLYGAFAITLYDWLIFGQWERIFARLPLAIAAVYIGLHWI